MKSKSSTWKHALSIAISLFLMLFIQSVHQAYAASCFTDTSGHWAESFICWMKTTGLSSGYSDGTFRPNNTITRAEVAALLYKEASGDTYITLGTPAWRVDTTTSPNAYITYYANSDQLGSNATGYSYYLLALPLITTLHNQQMTAKGAELCYDANVDSAGGWLSAVNVELVDGAGNEVTNLFDSTKRGDHTCRAYYFPSPAVLTSTDSLNILLRTFFTTTSDFMNIYSATAIQGFSPNAGVLAPSPSLVGPLPGVTP